MANKIIQWNARSIVNKKSDLIYLLNKYKPFLFSLCETWLRPGFTLNIKNYNTVREDRLDGYGGVALLIKKDYPFNIVSIPVHSPEISILAVIVNKICFVSVYISHTSINTLNEVGDILLSLPKPLIITGDFNCHHQSWGCSVSTCYGNKLLDILDRNNLCVINNGNPTRRTNLSEGSSVVDLTICSPQFTSQLSSSVLSSTFGSDHYPIITSFPLGKLIKNCTKLPPRYNISKANSDTWYQFSNKVDIKLNQKISEKINDSCDAQIFLDALTESANEVFNINHGGSYIPSPPWWDVECKEYLNKRKKAEKIFKNNMTIENLLSLKEITNKTKLLFKRKKRDSWQKFCASLSPNTPSSAVWKNIRRFRSAYNTSPSPTFPSFLIDDFLDRISPPTVNFCKDNLNDYDAFYNESSELNSPFSMSELKNVLKHVSDSAPGLDGIYYSFIAHLNDRSMSFYLNLINSIFHSGHIPSNWKSQIIIPILKPNKDPSSASSYRPIALSSVLLKICEQLIKNRLEWYVESNGLLSASQFGFRRNRSSIDNISLLTTDIRLAFSVNNSVLAAFLDLSNAYDNVVIPILKQKLLYLQIPKKIIRFIINMLSDRSISLIDGDQKYSRVLSKGLPQGSVLSPILYNIYTYDLDLSIDRKIEVLQYADDLLLYVKSNNIELACTELTTSLQYLKKWLDDHGLNLSPSKSSIVLFSRKRSTTPIHVYYDETIIPQKDEYKFLGVILDNKLTGIPHCNFIASKCEKIINIIRCLAGIWWGAHPFYLKLVYNALIRSVMEYGSFLLEPGLLSGFKMLNKIQNKCLRIICGAMKSSPINALQIECCDPPLQLRRQYLSDKFLFRRLQLSNHPLIEKLHLLAYFVSNSSYWIHKSNPCLVNSYFKFKSLSTPLHQSNMLPLFSCPYESLILSPQILNIGISKSDFLIANEKFNAIINKKFKNSHLIFTDASKHDVNGTVGVGIIHRQYNIVQKVKLPPESSVFSGECLGIFKALEYIILAKLNNSIIFTDSLSSLQALEKNPFKIKQHNPIIFDIRKLLSICLSKNYNIKFSWIPGHSGIQGNVIADSLANEAISCGDLVPYKIYCSDLLSIPKLDLDTFWKTLWEKSSKEKGNYYYSLQPDILSKPWFFSMNFNRRCSSIISRLRLGHTCTPAHLSKLKITNNSSCLCGCETGDANHFFFSCPLYDRIDFLKSLLEYQIPFPTSITCLLYIKKYYIYKIISDYIITNNIEI